MDRTERIGRNEIIIGRYVLRQKYVYKSMYEEEIIPREGTFVPRERKANVVQRIEITEE